MKILDGCCGSKTFLIGGKNASKKTRMSGAGVLMGM